MSVPIDWNMGETRFIKNFKKWQRSYEAEGCKQSNLIKLSVKGGEELVMKWLFFLIKAFEIERYFKINL